MLIQGSFMNRIFDWINSYKFKNPYIIFIIVLFRLDRMFNNMDMINVVTNTNNEEQTISPGFYSIAEIIDMLNNMFDTTFSISSKASSYECVFISSPHIPSILPMPRTMEKPSDWKDKRLCYPLHSMNRT